MVDRRIKMIKQYTESILMGICQKLQLTPYLYEQATERYNTIARIIKEDPTFRTTKLNIYPQGSFRLKTTIKPLSDEEYDLDFVAELPSQSEMSPQELYNHIARILRNDGIHNNKIELKSRCVRVKYANDFHMDIMPGKLVNESTHEIIVPDKKLSSWYHRSNPIAFADWFENQARTQILFEANQTRYTQANIEKVTEQEIAERLEPLRRAIQLVKRYRDVYCDKNGTEPVRSIVLCTLMGNITSFTGNTLDIIYSFCNHVNTLIARSGGKPFEVYNPVVQEKLTEKWEEGNNYNDFVAMMKALTSDVNKLRTYSINSDANRIIKSMFGETVTNSVIKDYAITLNEARKSENLSVSSSGTLNTNSYGVPVKKNTFYCN